MKFHLYTGNQLEVLADRFLTEITDRPPEDVFTKETVVVQNLGMATWLKQYIASNRPVAANIDFPFLNALIWDLLDVFVPAPANSKNEFTREIMSWRIYQMLSAGLTGELKQLSYYIKGENIELKRYQLAGKIAHTFDQYQIYRPELLRDWEQGKFSRDDVWQAAIWRQLAGQHQSRARRLLEFINSPTTDKQKELAPLERISVFGITTMPPIYLDFFRSKLSEIIPVHFFYMNPCREYWEFLMTDKERERRNWEKLEDEFSESGNELLASLGRQGREFFGTVMEYEGIDPEGECFHNYNMSSVLGCIQQDILDMNAAGEQSVRKMAKNDSSIQFHNCHNRMREVEILHDNLLNIIEKREVAPYDIIVMAPDISAYAPYIRAVFEREPYGSAKHIPFSISDRCIRDSSKTVDAFLELLKLSGSKFKATQILDILETVPVHTAFGIDDDQLELIRKWITDTGIRWGIDSDHRNQLDGVEFSEYSWRHGLKRMLMGFAVPDDGNADSSLICDILPYDQIEGGNAELLGHFCEFAEALFELENDLKHPRSLDSWGKTLNQMLSRFFLSDNDSFREIALIRSTLNKLIENAVQSGFNDPISIEVIRCCVTELMESETDSEGFLRGKVTFCSMQPMRSIPTRVICLLGMNDGEFPRSDTHLGFDVIASNLRACDRSKRFEDRYLFLEALLSARDCLYISYQGMDEKDNSAKPPAVPVCELRDFLNSGFKSTLNTDAFSQLETIHKLQAFDHEYFSGGQLFSYSEQNYSAANALLQPQSKKEFFPQDLELRPRENQDEIKHITLSDLVRFLRNPAAFLINRRLETIIVPGTEDEIQDTEPFGLDGLGNYQLNQIIIDNILDNKNLSQLYQSVKHRDLLPPGMTGEKLFAEKQRELEKFVNTFNLKERVGRGAQVNAEITVGSYKLTGKLSDIANDEMTCFRFASFKGKDALETWIRHLLFTLHSNREVKTTAIIGTSIADPIRIFHPLPREVAAEQLENIIKLYSKGQIAPLPFFPQASFAYATGTLGRNKKEPLIERKTAQSKTAFAGTTNFSTGEYSPGEADDPAIRKCFTEEILSTDVFAEMARTVYEPFYCDESGRIQDWLEEVIISD